MRGTRLGGWLVVSMLSTVPLVAGGNDAPLAAAVQRMDRPTVQKLLDS